jgi:hypothetical protein
LILIIIGASIYFPLQQKIPGFILSLALAGFGCSAVFPILLSMMEKELLTFSRGGPLLHYIETSLSVMLAGYFFGVGTVDLVVQKWGENPWLPLSAYFHIAAFAIAITGSAAVYLNLTLPKKQP